MTAREDGLTTHNDALLALAEVLPPRPLEGDGVSVTGFTLSPFAVEQMHIRFDRLVEALAEQPAGAVGETTLRRLLAIRYSGAALYHDDGELQDASTQPHIDFLRDAPDDIERKILERAKRTMEASGYSNPVACADNPHGLVKSPPAASVDATRYVAEQDALAALPNPMPSKQEEWMAKYVIRMVECGIHADDAWELCRSGASDHDYDSDPREAADHEMSCFTDDGDGPVDCAEQEKDNV